MNVLFIHQNFPAQFKNLGPALASQPGNRVIALTSRTNLPASLQGIEVRRYTTERHSTKGLHPWVTDLETKTIRAEACFRAALALSAEGFEPDIIIAHPGWGESLFLKEVWPQAKLGIYCEFFYQASGADIGFDPEFPESDPSGTPCRLRMRNVNNLLHFDIADAALAPTHWQASTFPQPFRDKISVIHDGVDTDRLIPSKDVWIKIGGSLKLTRKDEIITFVNRNLEPLRGCHIFMRALPELLRRRPNARVIIVGGDEGSYGAPRADGKSWKQHFQQELRTKTPAEARARVHFVGNLAYADFIRVLQLSTVHIYLTYPFVLSWSLLEAMSVGCAVVASDTSPLQEVITDKENGRLVNFFDSEQLTEEVIRLLEDPAERQRLGANARQFAIEHYDLQTACLPQQLAWVTQLSAG